MPTLVLIHSPFAGPSSWLAVASELEAEGHHVAVPSLTAAFEGREPYMVKMAEAIWQGVPTDEPAVLIAHSGAGALIPSALAIAPVAVDGVVFVDAGIPHPGSSWRLDAPAELTERLDMFTDCGLLPEWNRWFSARLLRELLPDDEQCEDFIDELPRVPASYLDEVVPEVSAWPPAKGAYLQLSEAYSEEALKAANMGWEVGTLDLHHLAMLTLPEEVAEALRRLVRQLY